MRLTDESHPAQPALDMDLTGTLLGDVGAGHETGVTRVFLPGPTLAFGRRDRLADGFAEASRIARDHGFEPVVRHGGGLAVAYDENSVIVESIVAETTLIGDTAARFEAMATLIQTALEDLGVDAEMGELPGEYCPGRFSLHLSGGAKIVGMAQRVIRGASLTTAVISVADPTAIRAVLIDVYASLGLALDPGTVGAVIDQRPRVTPAMVTDALVNRLER